MTLKVSPAWRAASLVEGSDAAGILHEMINRLVADFGFENVKLAGESHLNRTTEPVARFLIWLESTPEAQAALLLAFRRLAANPHLG
jgi:hypothetical protein